MIDLKPLTRAKKDNRYCGPAVVSFVTGVSTRDVARLIRQQTGRRSITGTSTVETRQAFRALGFDFTRFVVECGTPKPTLAAWLKASKNSRTPGRVFLLVAGNHWQLITGRRYACGRIGEIVSVRDKRVKRRARVTEVYELREIANGASVRRQTLAMLESLESASRSNSSDRAYVRRVAAQHGIEIDVDRFDGGSMSIYCFPPAWFQALREEGALEHEGFCGDSDEVVGYDWSEARQIVDAQAAVISKIQNAVPQKKVS